MYELAKLTAWMKKHIKYFLLGQYIRNYKWIDSKSDSISYSSVSRWEPGIFLRNIFLKFAPRSAFRTSKQVIFAFLNFSKLKFIL
jgi:hypothetical protein